MLTRPERPAANAGEAPDSKAAYSGTAALDSSELQDFVDALPEIVTTAGGAPLDFQLRITLGNENAEVAEETVEKLVRVLSGVHRDFRTKR